MDVYLVQHGEALSEEQAPQRPLSVEGRTALTKVAEYLATRAAQLIHPPILEVRHSGKLRARQTAELLAQAICPHASFIVSEGMNPKDDPQQCYGELMAGHHRSRAILLVGHLPHLAGLAGLLLTGDADTTPIRFVNAGVLKICSTDPGWAVDWYLTPACTR